MINLRDADVAAQLWDTRHNWTLWTKILPIEYTVNHHGEVVFANRYSNILFIVTCNMCYSEYLFLKGRISKEPDSNSFSFTYK